MEEKIQATADRVRPGQIYVTYYTDPLCCWSWAMEPSIEKLRTNLNQNIVWRYRMGGLIPSWKNFSDQVNSVTRPLQMGPVWMHASVLSGVSIDHNLWFRDPPASSYPACIAFKAAQLQSEEYAATYLKSLWKTCMGDGINISRQDVLMDLAHQLKQLYPAFDIKLFLKDLLKDRGREAFRKDLQEVKLNEINRFPTFILRRPDRPSLLIAGYRSYHFLQEAIETL